MDGGARNLSGRGEAGGAKGVSAGLMITVVTLTALLKWLPLKAAYPITTGLAVIGVQIAFARWLFREAVWPVQWLGMLFIVGGIVLIGGIYNWRGGLMGAGSAGWR